MEGRLKLDNKVNLDLERRHPGPEGGAGGRGRGLPLCGGPVQVLPPHPGPPAQSVWAALHLPSPAGARPLWGWATRVTAVSQNALLAPGAPRPCQVRVASTSAAGPSSPFTASGLVSVPNPP